MSSAKSRSTGHRSLHPCNRFQTPSRQMARHRQATISLVPRRDVSVECTINMQWNIAVHVVADDTAYEIDRCLIIVSFNFIGI